MSAPDQPGQPKRPEQILLHGQTIDPDTDLGADRSPLASVYEPTHPTTATPPNIGGNAVHGGLGRWTGQRSFTLAPHPGLLNDAEIEQFVAAIHQMAAQARQAKREDQGKPDTTQGAPQDDAQAERD